MPIRNSRTYTFRQILDRGSYTLGTGQNTSTAVWSDSGLNIGVRSLGAVSAFADLGVRASTGFYDQQAPYYYYYPLPRVGADLTQTRADAGVNASGRDYDVTAGVGAFWIDYAGGTTGLSRPAKTALALPSIQAQLFPNQRWSLDLQDSDSFTLPTFVDQYEYSGPGVNAVEYDRNALVAETLTYTDQARLRVSLEQATQHVAGATSGTITSAGLSATWQVAPSIALRAWTMHVTDTVPAYALTTAYDGSTTPTVNAFWLTYDATRRPASRCDLPARLARRSTLLSRRRRPLRTHRQPPSMVRRCRRPGAPDVSRRGSTFRRSLTPRRHHATLLIVSPVRAPAAPHRRSARCIGGGRHACRRSSRGGNVAWSARGARREVAVARTAAQQRLARQIDAALAVDLHDLDHDLVADLDDVFDFIDARRRELADVDEAFLAGQNLHERADRDDARHRAEVGLADHDLFGEVFDDLLWPCRPTRRRAT